MTSSQMEREQPAVDASKRAAIRSPLRYPGGKQKALIKIFQRLPLQGFTHYREPFVGGGSVFIAVRQRFPDAQVWINDLNPDLIAFWRTAQSDLAALVDALRALKASSNDGRALWAQHHTALPSTASDFERALRFFVINRISFSGTSDSGGYSPAAYSTRFTNSSIDRLAGLGAVLADVQITNLDYRNIVGKAALEGQRTFMFLDPPYWSATKSKLYGVNGHLHTGFDHPMFAHHLERCPHQWLVTYDDSPPVREHFAFARLETWQLQYGMNNVGQAKAAIGRELFLRNYDLGQKLAGNSE